MSFVYLLFIFLALTHIFSISIVFAMFTIVFILLQYYSNKDLQRMGLTWEEVEASAQDRQTWRQRVALCIEDAG